MYLSARFLLGWVLLCLILCASANAQYRIDTWTTDDGLPQNSVTGLTQTTDGYIWLTTNDGLVRFDGLRFTVFDKSNTPELTTNRLTGAFGDSSGRLWFQAEDGGIGFYQNGTFTVAAKPNELSTIYRSPFFDDHAGGVMLYANQKNLRYQNGKFVPVEIAGLAADSVIMLSDKDGGFWFYDSTGVRRVKNGEVTKYDLREFSADSRYKVAYQDRSGGVWLGYSGEIDQPNGAPMLRIKDGRVQRFDFPAETIRHFAEDAAGNLWITVADKGLYVIDKASVAAAEPNDITIRLAAEIAGISPNSSGFLAADREGGMWAGTEHGLARVLPQVIRVFSKQDGLPEDNVYPIYQDGAGAVWAGIWQNSLIKYDGGKFATVMRNRDSFFITSIFEDNSNRLWLGNLGTLRYLENGKVTNFTKQTGLSDYTEFSAIIQDRSGAMWFGTNRGLSRYADGEAKVFTVQDGLPDNYIVALLETRDGKMWVGTRGGLAVIDNGSIKSFTTADGLASNYIRSLYEDSDGRLWIGSYDGGLTRFADGKFAHFTAKDGLSSNGVFCILEDDHGWFWINSNQGIYRVSKQELNDFVDGKIKSLTSIAYNKRDGLLNVEGNGGRQPAGIKARDGKLWFPTVQGIAVVDPKTVVTNPLPPPVLIEDIVIDRNPVITSHAGITLAPDQNNLEIAYTGLSFINSEQVKFKYKLDGLENDWNEVGVRRAAYYSYLPPGEYTFRVIAANRDGVWNTEGASIKVKVLPPFYRTRWFVAACIFALVMLTFFVYRYRIGQLKRRAAQQEDFSRQLINSQETERGRIAAELHDGLSQSLVIIKNRAMLSLTTPDDHTRALEQLREIAEASTYAIDEVKDIIYDLRPIQLDRLGLTGAIEDMVEKVAEVNNLKLVKNCDNVDEVFSKEFENSIYRIVQESLNNIIKHSGATQFDVSIKKFPDMVDLTIKDNGKGFAAEETSGKREGGFGLVGIVERAKLLGGHASIESNKGTGTVVSIVLPITLKP